MIAGCKGVFLEEHSVRPEQTTAGGCCWSTSLCKLRTIRQLTGEERKCQPVLCVLGGTHAFSCN